MYELLNFREFCFERNFRSVSFRAARANRKWEVVVMWNRPPPVRASASKRFERSNLSEAIQAARNWIIENDIIGEEPGPRQIELSLDDLDL